MKISWGVRQKKIVGGGETKKGKVFWKRRILVEKVKLDRVQSGIWLIYEDWWYSRSISISIVFLVGWLLLRIQPNPRLGNFGKQLIWLLRY